MLFLPNWYLGLKDFSHLLLILHVIVSSHHVCSLNLGFFQQKSLVHFQTKPMEHSDQTAKQVGIICIIIEYANTYPYSSCVEVPLEEET